MTKQEVLNAVIEITRKTGQGLTHLVCLKDETIDLHLKELIKEGYVTKHEVKYSFLPKDVFYMPKNCYNIWTDPDGNHLTYVRIFLGNDDAFTVGQIQGPSPIELLADFEFIKEYSEWLLKNQKELEKLKNLELITLPNSTYKDFFSEKDLEFIQSRDWYKENKTVQQCVKENEEQIEIEKEVLSLYEKMFVIYDKEPGKYKERRAADEKEYNKTKEVFERRKKIISYLTNNIKNRRQAINVIFKMPKSKKNVKV